MKSILLLFLLLQMNMAFAKTHLPMVCTGDDYEDGYASGYRDGYQDAECLEINTAVKPTSRLLSIGTCYDLGYGDGYGDGYDDAVEDYCSDT